MARFANKRIGILGGAFNPVHNGHIHMALYALEKLRLNRVVFVPAGAPPHKKICSGTSARDRLGMLFLAIAGRKKFEISRYELNNKGVSYSVKTAAYFKKKYGKNAKLFFLIGADSAAGLSDWKKIGTLRKIVRFAVMPRPGYTIPPALKGAIKLNMPKKNVSSTAIRGLAKKRKEIKRLVPPEVEKYIRRKKLYR